MVWACSMHKRNKNCVHHFSLKSVKKMPLDEHRNRWNDNIKIVLRELWCEYVNWVHLEAKRFGRWYITLRITGLLDFVHRPEF
jgi:hypothetical protein